MRRCCGPKICSRRSRRRWSGARRASRTGSASAARLQPVDGVQGDAALAPDLEVQVRSLIARPTAHVAHDLSLDHALSLGHGGIVQIAVKAVEAAPVRSEEHTSELQSRLHLVCRLLLEKKKKTNKNICISMIKAT